mmetsp:Transcript_10813/g.36393  ORF Transcript_10813/g.36393 Transcript_10813/m.36393 type:complete len:305 (-) Transcript_10813:1277-2191(-)
MVQARVRPPVVSLSIYSRSESAGNILVGEELAGMGENSTSSQSGQFNVRKAVGNLATYQKEHPDFAEGVAIWMLVGNSLFIIGVIMAIFSEVKAVLICRDQDFRKSLWDNGFMKPSSAGIAELEERESMQMRPRAYLTFLSLLFMYIGIGCMLYPLCDVLDIIGLPTAPCFVLVVFGSFFASFCVLTFILFLAWSCTRFYAAMAFLVISVSGMLLLPTGNVILIIIWMVVTFGGGYWYFKYLPEFYSASGDELPFWVQDVGELSVTWDAAEWGETMNTAFTNFTSDVKNSVPTDASALLGEKKK